MTKRASAPRGIRDAVWSATFGEDEATVEAARWIVWEASQELGARPRASTTSTWPAAAARSAASRCPAINLRTQVFDMARGHRPEASAELDSGAIIFELARSEQEYTFQRPGEYITSVLAGAIAAGWQGPVFVQGDHYQFNAKKYAVDPEAVTASLRKATSTRWASATATSTSIRRRSWTCRCRPSTSSSARTTSVRPSCRRSSGPQ